MNLVRPLLSGLSILLSTSLALVFPSLLPAPWGMAAAVALALLLAALGFLRRAHTAEPLPEVALTPEVMVAVTAPETPAVKEDSALAPRIGALHYVSRQLNQASVAHIREILAPLSTSLFGVKANLQGLLKKSHELETSFRNDSQGLGETVSRFSTQSDNIRRYAQDLDVSVKQFSASGSEMTGRLTAITEASRQINDVAERIKVLSINASIEAARAGKQGAGFKIISQEVRKLAEDTNLFASQIEQTITTAIGDTRTAFEQFTKQSFQRAEEMHVILKTTEDLETFVKGLFAMIDGIFQEYDGFVSKLESELDHISPTLQRNEIATQQIENTWRGLQENLKAVFPAQPDGTAGLAAVQLRAILETFARYLTTPLEAAVLRRIGGESGLDDDIVHEASGNDITLF